MKGKKYIAAKAKIDSKKSYTPDEAVALVKETSAAKFDATVELHCHLGIDPKKGDQLVRGTMTLPHTVGKPKRVIAFVEEAKTEDAKSAGADVVATQDTIDELIKTGKIDFDIAVATPAMMPKLAKLAKILGPKGLMPNPKTETVSPDVKKMIESLKKGKMSFKNDDTANLHLAIGKVSWDTEKISANLNAALETIKKYKPATSKGTYLQNVVITTTMGPGIKVAVI
ncbi:MAG: 50S ribosomal protein L1, partial [Candidatus Magasanikbacteria bacterium GW2011_GWA2_45_39]|uniref:Large ribosomal subunit protein uL1 n=2 Tax=Candidatus Magasanikiibacteriota TaxID=1752731 RepID=A0A0G1N083_9BACT